MFSQCKTKFLPFFLFSKGQNRFCLHAIRLLKVTFAIFLPLLFVCKFLCFLAKQKVYDFKRRVPIKKRLFVLSFCRSTLCRWQILCLLCVSMMCFQVFSKGKTKFLPFFLFSKGQNRFCLHAIRLLKVTFAIFSPLLFSVFC